MIEEPKPLTLETNLGLFDYKDKCLVANKLMDTNELFMVVNDKIII